MATAAATGAEVRALSIVVLLLSDVGAWACAACGCGDQSLTALGVEQPYVNRLRVALEGRLTSLDSGDSSGQKVLSLRSSLTLLWAPHTRFAFAALLPWSSSWLLPHAGGPSQLVSGLSDLELSMRAVVYRDRRFSAHHLLWLSGGLKFPTGPRISDARGYPVPDDDQPGSGSWDPFFGAAYGYYGDPMALFFSASYRQTTPGPFGYRFGSTLGATATVQLHPVWWLAMPIGFEFRWAESDSLPNRHAAPNTGGALVDFSPGVIVSPLRSTNLQFRLSVGVPVVQGLHGVQRVGPQTTLMIAYDIL